MVNNVVTFCHNYHIGNYGSEHIYVSATCYLDSRQYLGFKSFSEKKKKRNPKVSCGLCKNIKLQFVVEQDSTYSVPALLDTPLDIFEIVELNFYIITW